jgi:hypothetical protein
MTKIRQPFYHRLLRLRHLRPGPTATFVFFEGSVMLAVLLSLAEIVAWWSVLVIPATVGVMVKLNDVVAGVLRRPEVIAQLARARMAEGIFVGRSPRPSPARLTAWINLHEGPADARSRPEAALPPDMAPPRGVARGIAAVPSPDGYPTAPQDARTRHSESR